MRTKTTIYLSLLIIVLGFVGYTGHAQAQTATLYLDTASPSGSYGISDSFSVPIRLDSDVTVNGVQSYINFNASVLSVSNIDITGSPFNIEFKNMIESGQIQLESATFSGVPAGTGILIGTITFQAIGSGITSVDFDSMSAVVPKGDPTGNILTSTTGSTYTVGIQTTATLTVSPSSESYNVGDNFSVNVNLNTGGQDTDGTDIRYLKFNPSVLSVQSITPGSLYPDNPIANNFDNVAGTIRYQHTTGGGTVYNSNNNGILATINFQAIGAGISSLNFDFILGNTTDCNVSKAGGGHEDILVSVTHGSYNISEAADITPPANVTSFQSSPGDGQVILAWTNPSDSDFAGTVIRRNTGGYPSISNGIQVYNGTATNYTDTGLTNGTTYYYTAFSYDEVPNYASGAQVSETPIASTATINIALAIEGKTNFSNNITLYFLTLGTEDIVHSFSRDINASGVASVDLTTSDLPFGNYDVRVKISYSLTKKLDSVSWSALGMALDFGDILAGNLLDTDNIINSLDWSLMAEAWNSSDAVSDITQDGLVNSLDWHYLNKNWGQTGQ